MLKCSEEVVTMLLEHQCLIFEGFDDLKESLPAMLDSGLARILAWDPKCPEANVFFQVLIITDHPITVDGEKQHLFNGTCFVVIAERGTPVYNRLLKHTEGAVVINDT